jgi:hypothetical protein
MNETQPVRRNGEGFQNDKALYLEHLGKANLPETLTHLRHTLDWPVDMINPLAHITCFFGQSDYSVSKNKTPHFALDIQVPLGTEVKTPETAIFVYKDSQSYINCQRALTDVLLYSSESGLAYWLVHLDANNLPSTIAQRHWFDRYSEEIFQRCERIGQVGLFFNQWAIKESEKKNKKGELHSDIEISSEVEAVYERSYNHLHFELHYQPNYHGLAVDVRNPINPLALLKRLY